MTKPLSLRHSTVLSRGIDFALMGVVFAFVVWTSLRDPEWNFDAVCYVGAAAQTVGADTSEAHRVAYEELRAAAPRRQFRAIAKGSKYRRQVSASAESFAAQLPMYRNKPGYVWLIAAGRAAGFNGAHVTYWISILSTLWIGVVVRLWVGRTAPGFFSAVVASGVVLAYPMHATASASNPDVLAAAVAVTGSCALAGFSRPALGLVLLGISALVRPDHVLLLLVVATWSWRCARPPFRVEITGMAVSGLWAAGLWALVRFGLGGASIGATLAHAFGTRIVDAAGWQVTITPAEYLEALRSGVLGTTLMHPTALWLYGLLAFVSAALLRSGGPRRANRALLIAAWIYAGLHFLLFPELRDRFFLVPYVVTLATLGIAAGPSVERKSAEAGGARSKNPAGNPALPRGDDLGGPGNASHSWRASLIGQPLRDDGLRDADVAIQGGLLAEKCSAAVTHEARAKRIRPGRAGDGEEGGLQDAKALQVVVRPECSGGSPPHLANPHPQVARTTASACS